MPHNDTEPRPVHVLIVDDDARILICLRRMLSLSARHWSIACETDPRAAATLINETAFDVIIADNQMPWINGPTLLTQVQARRPDTLRFIMTGDPEGLDGSRVDGIIPKPCPTDELLRTVTSALAVRQLSAVA